MKFLLIFLFTYSSFACHIKTSKVIIKLAKKLDSSLIKESNCTNEENEQFLNSLSSLEGKINSSALTKIIGNSNIKISPNKIIIKKLINYLYTQYDESKYKIENTNIISSLRFMALDSLSEIKVKCLDCHKSGFKNFKLEASDTNVWISSFFTKATKALVLKRNFRNRGQSLKQEDLEEKNIFIKENQNLFYDIKNITHYKVNKFLPQGHILKSYDLAPTKLIKTGKTIDLIIKTDNLSLKTKATARQSGTFGKTVELINLKTKKKILATVTGQNQATLTL